MLPVATADDLGGIKVGGDFTMVNGTLELAKPYGLGPLDMLITYGSPKVDTRYAGWNPYCVVTVYGPANMLGLLLVGDGLEIVDSHNIPPTGQRFQIGNDGQWSGKIRMPSTVANWSASVAVVPLIQTGKASQALLDAMAVISPIERVVTFAPMLSDIDVDFIDVFSYTRAAPADGTTLCQINLIASYAGQTSVVLQIDSNASDAHFQDGSTKYTAHLNNCWAQVGVYSKSKGIVPVMISPQPGLGIDELVYAYPSFVDRPQVMTLVLPEA